MKSCAIAKAKKIIVKTLLGYGIGHDDAEITAFILIDGTLRGHYNHGVERIFEIIEGIENKVLSTIPNISFTKEDGAFNIINANNYIGYPVGYKAMNTAVDLAKKYGVAMVGVINAGHLGSLGYYSELASAKDVLGITMCTTSPAVIVPGGTQAFLGTNPICYSFPLNHGLFTADFSTSMASRGSILEAKKANIKLTPGTAVDSDGNPTLNPEDALKGGILPYGGDIKGMLLSMFVAIMAGPLIGGVSNENVRGTRYMNESPNKGDLFICINIDENLYSFKKECSDFIEKIIDNSNKVRMPRSGLNNDTDWNKTEIDVSDEFYCL